MNVKAMHDYLLFSICMSGKNLSFARAYMCFKFRRLSPTYIGIIHGIAISRYSYLLIYKTYTSIDGHLDRSRLASYVNIFYIMLIIEVHRTSSETTCPWCKIQYPYLYIIYFTCMYVQSTVHVYCIYIDRVPNNWLLL